MIEYRRARPEEREAYIAFADMVFQDQGTDIHFEQALPKVYGRDMETAEMQYIAVDDAEGIRGLVAVLPNKLRVGGEVLKTGYIGTVSVHPESRGQGHMKRLMAQALDAMRADGVDLALLGGQRQRYEYFGFVRAGVADRFTATARNLRHALTEVLVDGIRFEEILPDTPLERAVQVLHDGRKCCFDRGTPGFATVCRSYGGRPWAAIENRELLGFAVASADSEVLTDVCVQEAAALDRVLKAWILNRQVKALTVLLPDWERGLIRRLNGWAESLSCGACLMARFFDYPKVLRAFLELKGGYARLEDGALELDCEGQVFTLRVRNGKAEVADGAEHPLGLNALEAGRLFFELFDYEGRPETPAGWFPLPLFASAPDGF